MSMRFSCTFGWRGLVNGLRIIRYAKGIQQVSKIHEDAKQKTRYLLKLAERPVHEVEEDAAPGAVGSNGQ